MKITINLKGPLHAGQYEVGVEEERNPYHEIAEYKDENSKSLQRIRGN